MPVDTAADRSFQHLTRNVNKIVEQMQKSYFNFRPTDTWSPSVNLYETDEMYLACVDLSGVDKAKIDLELIGNSLTLRGNRNVPSYEDDPDRPGSGSIAAAEPDVAPRTGKVRVHVMEIDHGAFFREIELPAEVRRDKIEAHHRNGLLWIEIPKT